MSQTDIVERLRGCTDKKYPGFHNLNTEAADTITQLRERLDAVEKAEEEKAILLGRYIAAMWENYPTGWAADPGNPELCIGNIRRFHQEQSDQLRQSNERLEKEKAELCKQWQRQRFALNQIAWPESYNLKGLTVETCRHIARDTLQIGTLTAESGTEGKGTIPADGMTREGPI